METLFAIFLDVCLPIVVVMGIGWFADRRFNLNLQTLVRLNLYFFVPAFIFVRLTQSNLSDRVGFSVILFTLCVMALMGVVSLFFAGNRRERISMQLGTIFYNSGNWGIPLMALAFSDLGPVVQVFVLMTMNVGMFTVGIFLASGHDENEDGSPEHSRWRRILPMLRQPSIYAILAALLCRNFGNPLEEIRFIWTPLTYLADALIAFALITLGVQLSKTRPPRVEGHLARALIIRLIGGPCAAIGLTVLFGFEGEMAAILILGAASPTAVNAALVAHEFGGDSKFATAIVFYSTLLAVIVVTALLGILQAGWIPWALTA